MATWLGMSTEAGQGGPRDAQSSLPDLVAFAFPPTIKTDADL
jgi:hypothetical protein